MKLRPKIISVRECLRSAGVAPFGERRNIEHRTSNVERPIFARTCALLLSMFDVQRSMFDVPPNPQFRTPHSALRTCMAFTLLELLVVIVIIGLLATIGLPSIRNMTKSNSMIAANRQLLDDIALARRSAIANHTTVYMVFIPPDIWTYNLPPPPAGNDPTVANMYSNLWRGQYTTYALISLRSVGDQPGVSTPRYITSWRSLPNGVFIAAAKYTNYVGIAGPANTTNDYVRAFPADNTTQFPFPTVTTNINYVTGLPYIGFNYLGQLISTNFEGEAIPLARGSIFYTPYTNSLYQPQPADIQENPPSNSVLESNIIHIDWLTGKARLERQEVQ